MNFFNFFGPFFMIPPVMQFGIIFIYGLIIGSFLNVLIFRAENDEGIGGRSHCVKCHYNLVWTDLIPILSFLFLKGKCRKCHQKISIQYPLVELSTGLIFMLIFAFVVNQASPVFFNPAPTIGLFIWHATIFSLLLAIFVFDLKHKLIPNLWSYIFAVMALVQMIWVTPFSGILNNPARTELFLNLFSGLIFFIPFFLLWFISEGKWIGLGDGKLVLGIGWYLGFISGISAIVLAFWIGAFVAVVLLLIDRLKILPKSITMKTEIPFGPFLILSTVIHFFWTIDVIGISGFFLI